MNKKHRHLTVIITIVIISGCFIAAKLPTGTKYDYVSIVQVDNNLMISEGLDKFEEISVKGEKQKNDYHFGPLFKKINEYEMLGYEMVENNVFTIGQGVIPRNYILLRKVK